MGGMAATDFVVGMDIAVVTDTVEPTADAAAMPVVDAVDMSAADAADIAAGMLPAAVADTLVVDSAAELIWAAAADTAVVDTANR